MKSRRETLTKSERLCSRKITEDLFENGKIIYHAGFKVVWGVLPASIPYPARAAFTVPKRKFRLAVTRNLIKRRMREAYRKNKYILYDYLKPENLNIALVFIYNDTPIPVYSTVERSLKEIMQTIISNLKGA